MTSFHYSEDDDTYQTVVSSISCSVLVTMHQRGHFIWRTPQCPPFSVSKGKMQFNMIRMNGEDSGACAKSSEDVDA